MMRRMRALLISLIVVCAAPSAAQACSCVVPGDPQEEIARADAAVFGKIVKRDVNRHRREIRGDETVVYRLKVLRDYKGNVGRHLHFRSTLLSAACGLDLRRGQRIGLLLDRRNGRYSAGLCSVRSRKQLEGGNSARTACA
jgi:tissue inhibitor of metalloproteinase